MKFEKQEIILLAAGFAIGIAGGLALAWLTSLIT